MAEHEFFRYLPSSRKKSRRRKKKQGGICETMDSFLATLAPPSTKKDYKNREDEKRNILGVGSWRFSNPQKESVDIEEYDILIIDRKIKVMLTKNISTLPILQADLEKTIWIMTNGQPNQRIIARRNAVMLRRRIRDLDSTMELGLYIFKTADILEEYRNIVNSERKKFFIRANNYEDDPSAQRKEELIGVYLRIARDYIDLSNFFQAPRKMKCPSCNGMNFTVSMDEDSIYICNDCFSEVELLDEAPSFKDANRVNLSSKYTYTKKGHFVDSIKRFMGIQNTDPEKIRKVVAVLREEMRKHNLVAERGKKNSVTKDNLYMFLSEQDGMSNHYDDINLLHHIITGDPCPDISHLVDALNEDFDKFEDGYEDVKDPGRINSLNVDWKLFILLLKNGFPCKKDDFYILKTKAKEDEHIEKSKEVFENLGWPWNAV